MIIEFKKKSLLKPSKFFLERPKLLLPLLGICIVASYFFIDKSFALFFATHKNEWMDILYLINSLMTPFFTLLLLPFLFFFVRFLQRKDRKSRKLWFLCFATALPIFFASFVGVIIGRSNPEWLFLHKEMAFRFFQWNSTFHSFPSITSCNIAALGAGLALVYPKQSLKFFFAGLLGGMIPAVLTLCFVSDALAGIFIGMLLARAVFRAMRKEISFS